VLLKEELAELSEEDRNRVLDAFDKMYTYKAPAHSLDYNSTTECKKVLLLKMREILGK